MTANFPAFFFEFFILQNFPTLTIFAQYFHYANCTSAVYLAVVGFSRVFPRFFRAFW
jgi:hypothetical protein